MILQQTIPQVSESVSLWNVFLRIASRWAPCVDFAHPLLDPANLGYPSCPPTGDPVQARYLERTCKTNALKP